MHLFNWFRWHAHTVTQINLEVYLWENICYTTRLLTSSLLTVSGFVSLPAASIMRSIADDYHLTLLHQAPNLNAIFDSLNVLCTSPWRINTRVREGGRGGGRNYSLYIRLCTKSSKVQTLSASQLHVHVFYNIIILIRHVRIHGRNVTKIMNHNYMWHIIHVHVCV